MVKLGDTVRFLNAVGGGKVVRIENNTAYVEDEDGFENPVYLRECVVVDSPNAPKTAYDRPEPVAPSKYVESEKPKEEVFAVEETETGNKMNIVLAYEPDNIKTISSTGFAAYLVNDSNYYLYYTYLTRGDGEWIVKNSGIVEPNIQLLVDEFDHEDLPDMSRIAIQAVAFKKDKRFALKNPINFERRLDTTKFYKLHTFCENEYFDSNVLAFQVVKDDVPQIEYNIDPEEIRTAMREKAVPVKKKSRPNENHKREIIECDLHINELLDNTNGLSNADILGVQMDKFREVMNANLKRKGAKIVFIHGKGEGVLRKSILDEVKRKYHACTCQDASFREYGFGATLITIH